MALDYLLFFIIAENFLQYSINIYNLTQIFCSRQNSLQEEDDPPFINTSNRTRRKHYPI